MLLEQLGRLPGGGMGAGCWSTWAPHVSRGRGKPLGVASMNSGNKTAGPQDSSQDTQPVPLARADPQHPAHFPQHVPASSALTEKINIRVLDPFTIKPLDRKLILDSARATKGRILTVEDHYYEGEDLARARTTGAGRAGHRLDSPPLSQPREDSCGPGSPEQLGLGS